MSWRIGFRRCAVPASIAIAAVLLVGPLATASSAATAVNGGGSGFAALEIQQWQADTARKPYNLTVNYSAQSSGIGRANFANGLYDYGVSDVVYQPAEGEQQYLNQLQSGRCGGQGFASCVRYVPVSAGGLSFMYNIVLGSSRYTSLQLTPTQVCGIFTQNPSFLKWSDLASDNPQLASDNNTINAVTRQDNAGESYVLSQYCIAEAPGIWGQFISNQGGNHVQPNTYLASGQPISSWPSPLNVNVNGNDPQESGADGVADFVADPNQGQNAITYDAAGYALVRNFPTASVQNAAGAFQQPNETNVTVALQYATGRGDGTFNLNFNGPDPRAYFPSTYSYALVQAAGQDPGKGATLGQFLCYDIGFGQTIAPQLRYARLSAAIVSIAAQAISAIPGAPSVGACTAGAPPPPAAVTVLGGPAAASNATSAGTSGAATAGTPGAATAAGASPAALAAAAAAANATTTTVNKAQQEANAAAQQAARAQDAAASGPAKKDGPSNADAMWYLLLGALVCAIGVFVTSGKRTAS